MTTGKINILLADDDLDDCSFFEEAIKELEIDAGLQTVHNGVQLMVKLQSKEVLPDILFLDLNMPRKNGFQCLEEIKRHSKLKSIPIIIISTSYDVEKANQLHKNEAHYYICKPINFSDLKIVIQHELNLTLHGEHSQTMQPARENFFLTGLKGKVLN